MIELKVILLGVIIGMAYRFLARFVLPVFQLAKMTNEKLRDMERKQTEKAQPINVESKNRSKPRDTDYIDYEEIK